MRANDAVREAGRKSLAIGRRGFDWLPDADAKSSQSEAAEVRVEDTLGNAGLANQTRRSSNHTRDSDVDFLPTLDVRRPISRIHMKQLASR